MRGALKKPSEQLGSKIQRLTPGFNPEREVRAKITAKHSQVDRFGTPIPAAEPKRQTIQGEVIPRFSQPTAPDTTATAVTLPSMVTSASHQKLERMLDQALTRADAHKKALRYQAARHFWQRPSFLGRRTGIKIGLLLVLIVAAFSFAAWQKMPQLSAKLAGIRAHISASVPSYKPEGFSLAAPVSTQDGSVLMKYKSAADNAGFELTQKQSNMTSVSLAQSVVPHGAQVQTTQVGGNTIYIYGQNNDAAWVNNGVLYTIKDNAKLSSDQIINIVKGLN
ncbi:DUF4367 domain-containing protein [Candidatus Saccharibacteria bacterium]|nr:DUF4367 domain-containing protein [Candidatus Saccharibacteria bacterium]